MRSGSFTTVPLSPLRKAIAARMSEASRTIPHFRVPVDLDVDALLTMRQRLCQRRPEAPVSLNDMIVKACAAALMDVPAVNIQWADDAIHQYNSADVAVVVAIPGGLVTPIVRRANEKSFWEVSQEIRRYKANAMSNTLKMQDITGGTFSVSNLGMHAVDQFDAIINPPQCAIIALGRAKSRAVVPTRQEVCTATLLCATLSVDHRAIDGATAASFLSVLQQRIMEPDSLLPQE